MEASWRKGVSRAVLKLQQTPRAARSWPRFDGHMQCSNPDVIETSLALAKTQASSLLLDTLAYVDKHAERRDERRAPSFSLEVVLTVKCEWREPDCRKVRGVALECGNNIGRCMNLESLLLLANCSKPLGLQRYRRGPAIPLPSDRHPPRRPAAAKAIVPAVVLATL